MVWDLFLLGRNTSMFHSKNKKAVSLGGPAWARSLFEVDWGGFKLVIGGLEVSRLGKCTVVKVADGSTPKATVD